MASYAEYYAPYRHMEWAGKISKPAIENLGLSGLEDMLWSDVPLD